MRPSAFILSTVLASLMSVQAEVPSGSPDGIYVHPINPLTGKRGAIRIGDLDDTAPAHGFRSRDVSSIVNRDPKKKKGDNVHCDNAHTGVAADWTTAVTKASTTFVQGFEWAQSISWVTNDAVVFACGYGGGKANHAIKSANFDLSVLSDLDTCGSTASGWIDADNQVTLGRTISGQSFC